MLKRGEARQTLANFGKILPFFLSLPKKSVCQRLPKFARICQNLPKFAKKLFFLADIKRKSEFLANFFFELPKKVFAKVCQNFPKFAKKLFYWQME